MGESIVLDPAEMAPNRTELDLEAQLGIKIDKEGADWGESQVAVQLARQQVGSIVTDRHLEPVEMTIPLQVLKEGEVSLAEAAALLQQKVGMFQSDDPEPNWIRRDFDEGGEFTGSVAYIAHSAALRGLQGWYMANRDHAPQVDLKILRSPLSYATEEVEGEILKEEVARELKFELPKVLGTAPGLIRVRVKNLNAAAHWRSLIAMLESRDHPQNATKTTTADVVYEAEALTLAGGSVKAARAESVGEVVKNANLTAGWLTILSSKTAAGHMSHKGPRRLFFRVYNPGAANVVELQLQFRPLGASTWSETNLVVPVAIANNFSILDLGECRPELALIGSQQWEWRLQARAPGGSGTIEIDRVGIYSTEQMAIVRTPLATQGSDLSSQKSPETAASNAAVGTLAWTTPANAVSSNNVYTTATVAAGLNTQTQYLQLTKFKFAIPETATILGVLVEVERKANQSENKRNVSDVEMRLVVGGAVQTLVNYAKLSVKWPTADTYQSYGSATDLWGNASITPAQANAEGFGFALSALIHRENSEVIASVDHGRMTIYYTEAKDPNRVCFATRSMEMRSDGVIRQGETEDAWGFLVNEGFNFYAPPSYLEGRAMRGLILPSQGDLAAVADSGANKIQAQVFYRPAYHFARESL